MRRASLPGTTLKRLVAGLLTALVLSVAVTLSAQIQQGPVVGRNVNMVAGTEWPGGDPFLQRQNEPSLAASTRNPLHLVGGSNDYRTVDLPGLANDNETGDAWLSVYKSFDGGQRWSSTLLPGYPQDGSEAGLASPLKGYQAAADPVVRAGTSGLIYYNGLVFDRGDNGKSGIFLARFIDKNNKENGDPIAYLGTSMVATSTGTAFLDKPWMAVDIPRGSAPPQCIVGGSANGGKVKRHGHKQVGRGNGAGNAVPDDGFQRVAAGAIYVAYSSITGEGATLKSEILLKRSADCGATWSAPIRISRTADPVNQGATVAIDPVSGAVFVAYRRFDLNPLSSLDAIMVAKVPVGANAANGAGVARSLRRQGPAPQAIEKIFEHRKKRSESVEVADVNQLDQGTDGFKFRTNAYPTMTFDGSGRGYIAWAERGLATARPDPILGDSRILISTTTDGATFTAPTKVDDTAPAGQPTLLGHQLMPSLAFAGGKLMLIYYDVRETAAKTFGRFVSDNPADLSGNGKRQTIDIRAAVGTPGATPTFVTSTQVSDYLKGYRGNTGALEKLQTNPPNLPMFKLGTVPFIGDYIDLAPAQAFVPTASGGWAYNTAATADFPVFHAAWTDNRDVRPPTDGNWANYTPPTRDPSLPTKSLFDGTTTPPSCLAGNAGSRNQNVYTARIGGGLLVGAPGNAKPLSPTVQRGFVVLAQNQTTDRRTFRMTVVAQPVGGRASFEQFPLPPYTSTSPDPLKVLDVQVPPKSTASRTLFVTSSDPHAQINVTVVEVAAVNGTVVPGGLSGRVVLNPDIENPDIENPDIENPDIENPDIENAEVYNPDIENPDIENPSVKNPDIENPDIENPDIENVVVANPDIENVTVTNPDIENPDIENPDIENPDIENPDIENGTISDVTWTVSNAGNTTAAFNVNMFLGSAAVPTTIGPNGLITQLILYKTYTTPVAAGCAVKVETRNVLIGNVPKPGFIVPGSSVPSVNDPSEKNATIWLAPGEIGRITLRVFDKNKLDNITVTNADGTTASIDPRLDPKTVVTPGVSGQGVDVLDPPGATKPPLVTPTGSNLFFLQHPTAAIPAGVITPPVRVRAFDNTGAMLPGVIVSLSLVNPGLATLSGNVAASDVNGVATFPSLSVSLLGTYQLQASAASAGVVATAVSNPFTVAPIIATGWVASGSGTATLLDNGAQGNPAFQYQHNGVGNFNGAWEFSTVAAANGTVNLAYDWSGFHSFFQVTAGLDVFVKRAGVDVPPVVTLLNEGPVTCGPCVPPSGGFRYAGSTSVSVQAGDTYGFRLRGSHFDGTYALEGTFKVVVGNAPFITSATPAAIGAGQMIVLRGGNMPATGPSGIIFTQGAVSLAASYVFTVSPGLVIARSPVGLTAGPATVRATAGIAGITTPAFPITISPTVTAPRLTSLRSGTGGVCGAPISTVSGGQQVGVLADGVDTSGTIFVWDQGGTIYETTTSSTTGGPGSVCTLTTAPAALTNSPVTLYIKIGASGPASNGTNVNGPFLLVPSPVSEPELR